MSDHSGAEGRPARGKLEHSVPMTAGAKRVAALFVILGAAPLVAQPESDLERAAERRFRSAEQFYAAGRHAQALRDFEAIVEAMPGSRLADDAALRVARHRFAVEGDPAAAEAALERLFREYPAGDAVPGAHLLLGQIAFASTPPRLLDALAEFERVLSAAGSLRPASGASWSFEALTGIAEVSWDFANDSEAAGALLSALHETSANPVPEPQRLAARFFLARALARDGAAEAALAEIASLRSDLLRLERSAAPEPEVNGFSPAALADRASDLAVLIARYRAPGGLDWSVAGAVSPPRRLDDPRRVRVAGGLIHVLDQDTDEVQSFTPAGEFQGAFGIDDPWDLAFADLPGASGDGTPLAVVAAGDALVMGGNLMRLAAPVGGSPEPLRRIRAAAATPFGIWVWDDREKAVFSFAGSGLFLGRVPHPELDEVHRIARHPAGHLIVAAEGRGVLGFDDTGRRIFHLAGERGLEEPVDLAFDGLGNLIVLGRGGPEIAVFDRDFARLATFDGARWPGGSRREPVSFDVGPDGSLYVLDEGARAVLVLR